jgi:hypothetical protein
MRFSLRYATMCKLLLLTAATLAAGVISASAEMQTLQDDIRFCPSWAEAHERTLAT